MAMGTKEVEVAVRDVENMRAAPPATTGKLTETGFVLHIYSDTTIPPGQLFLHCANGLMGTLQVEMSGFKGGSRSSGFFMLSSGHKPPLMSNRLVRFDVV